MGAIKKAVKHLAHDIKHVAHSVGHALSKAAHSTFQMCKSMAKMGIAVVEMDPKKAAKEAHNAINAGIKSVLATSSIVPTNALINWATHGEFNKFKDGVGQKVGDAVGGSIESVAKGGCEIRNGILHRNFGEAFHGVFDAGVGALSLAEMATPTGMAMVVAGAAITTASDQSGLTKKLQGALGSDGMMALAIGGAVATIAVPGMRTKGSKGLTHVEEGAAKTHVPGKKPHRKETETPELVTAKPIQVAGRPPKDVVHDIVESGLDPQTLKKEMRELMLHGNGEKFEKFAKRTGIDLNELDGSARGKLMLALGKTAAAA